METELRPESSGLMDIEAVQKALHRSRASVYRYANTDANSLNLPYNPTRLNPELRLTKDDLLQFHPNEVARFARDILKLKPVTIEVREMPRHETHELLEAILTELRDIHTLLKERS